MVTQRYDVLVVGAGSSGAVVAARLSEDASRSVCLVEAGPDFPEEADVAPAFLTGGNLLGEAFAGTGAAVPEHDWGYWSEPVADGRRVHLKRGRLVGGSSMVNGTVAVRGAPADFDRWQELGAPGWGWESVLPAYERAEGEVPIRRYPEERWLPLQHAFVEGFTELGFRRVADMNEPDAWDGVVGAWPQNRRNEIRQGTLVTYIRRARPRPNLTIRDRSLVDRVLLRGSRAIGVELHASEDRCQRLEADVVVLSGGAYGTPAILLRTGIGPAAELAEHGIRPAADLPVGRNLGEHPQCFFQLRTPPALAAMSGPGFAVVARGEGWWSFPLSLNEEEGSCGIAFALTSRDTSGSVRLASRNPAEPPLIDHAYAGYMHRGDFERAFAAFRALASTAALAGRGARDTDAGRPLDDVLAERLGTAFHPVGTCAIGKVVDDDLRVYGFENLYCADASVFPAHVTNNPNLTCFMVGERAAVKLATA